MINLMRIELKSGFATGIVSLMEGSRTSYTGSVDTDLVPGVYAVSVNRPAKRWVIRGIGGGMRFYVMLNGPYPFGLQYSPSVRLEVRATPKVGSVNEELLEGMGPDLYKNHPSYIDRVKAGHYDVAADIFTVDHEDGSTIEIDYAAVLANLQGKGSGTITVYVYYRNLQNYKIYPRIFDATTAPNIASMVREIEAALPGAKAMGKVRDFLLNLVQLRSDLPAKKPGTAWAVKPAKSAAAVREFLGITGNRPVVQLGSMSSNDCLIAAVEVIGGELRYTVKVISARGPQAETIKSAHRALIVAAAEEAKRMGQAEFKMHGVTAGPEFIRHADQVARAAGRAGSGVSISAPLKNNYEVTLNVAKVLSTNTP